MGTYHAGAPLERVHIDILGPFHPPSAAGNSYVLMIVDQFTKWMECFPLPHQTAEAVARTFVDGFVSRWGCPLQVHTDQGRQFEGQLFRAVCGLLQVAKTRTTPYRPSSNGQVERYNRTLLQLIRCYRRGNLDTWDEDLQLLAGAIRATVNRQTGYTANMMMLGHEVLQPPDLLLGTSTIDGTSRDPAEYVKTLRETLHRVHEEARKTLQATQARQKRTYDLKVHARSFEVGDLVYELNSATTVGQSSKLHPVWRGPLLVVGVKGPTLYQLKGRKHTRWVHHDRLKLCRDREIPLWVRRARHQLLAQGEPEPQGLQDQEEEEERIAEEDQQLGGNPEEQVNTDMVPEAEVDTGEQETLTDVQNLWRDESHKPLPPGEPQAAEPNQDTIPTQTTRRGRVTRRPRHLDDYAT